MFDRYNGYGFVSDEKSARSAVLKKYVEICDKYQPHLEIFPNLQVRPSYFPKMEGTRPGWEIGFSLYLNKIEAGRILKVKYDGEDSVTYVTPDFDLTTHNPDLVGKMEPQYNKHVAEDTDPDGKLATMMKVKPRKNLPKDLPEPKK